MNSCIYNGEVTHTRFKPVRHFLKYKTFSFLIDLDEINQLDRSINIFSHNKFNIFSFYDKDHGERDGSDLKEWVCLLYTSPSPRDLSTSRMPSSA